MSYGFGRQESICCDDNGHYRAELVAAHAGDCESFLSRHAVVVHDAMQQGAHQVRSLDPYLLAWIADARNLRLAWDYLAHNGGQAAGPNRHRFDDFENHDIWNYVRVIGNAIKHGSYRPGPVRHKRISKGEGRGDRTLTVANIEDRVVSRGVVQIIQPLYDPVFDDRSFGFRPGRGRQLALAHAMQLAKEQERYVWLVEDLTQAFDRVPHNRLLDVLRMRLPENVVQLIHRIIDNKSGRGLPQGSPLSPLMLNIYLDHFLDTRWRKLHPDLPLLRYADDLLILCHTEHEARSARLDLDTLLTPAAMLLKHCEDSVVDLALGQHAEWLGYQVARNKCRLTVTIAESSWNRLREKLVLAHSKPQSPLRAYATVNSWLLQQAPCYADTDCAQVYARLAETALALDFDEIPSRNLVLSRWKRSYIRWRRLSRDWDGGSVVGTPQDGGSACHVFPAPCSRGDGASADAPSPPFSSSERVTLYTDGCCLRNRAGGWAYLLEDDTRSIVERSAGLKRTTNNRAELLAVIHGLESLRVPASVRIITDSRYVADGINDWLPLWKAQGWRCGSHTRMRPLHNADSGEDSIQCE